MQEHKKEERESGFTLIELLIAIVVVGILTAVAIVGIAGLTKNGEGASCSATSDAVKAAQAVHYANNNGAYPTKFSDLTTASPAELELSGSASLNAGGNVITGNGWTLTSTSGGGTAPMTMSACP